MNALDVAEYLAGVVAEAAKHRRSRRRANAPASSTGAQRMLSLFESAEECSLPIQTYALRLMGLDLCNLAGNSAQAAVAAAAMLQREQVEGTLACILLERLVQHQARASGWHGATELNIHRLFLAAFLVATKLERDVSHAMHLMRALSTRGGVQQAELAQLEVAFLFTIGWTLHISVEQYATFCLTQYCARVCRFALGPAFTVKTATSSCCTTTNTHTTTCSSPATTLACTPLPVLHQLQRQLLLPPPVPCPPAPLLSLLMAATNVGLPQRHRQW
eukprot:TRINITY_DN284_c1_g2_i1.p1 TRINITY_DN284_c1_g2~~TRINITY_DN284_c1_g2_i1.p1  ORF type:complete len:275 (-),score=89.37 TRINITY_DN284_c1_g2_i1:74-898(-)